MAKAGVKATTLVLLKAGAAPDKVDGLGNSPMHIAEKEGNDKVVDLLLEWLPAKEPTPEPEAHPIEPDAGELRGLSLNCTSLPTSDWPPA